MSGVDRASYRALTDVPLCEEFRETLEEGERVFWSGKAKASTVFWCDLWRRFFQLATIILIFIGIELGVALAFGKYNEPGVMALVEGMIGLILGIAVISVFAGIAKGAVCARYARYLITDRRILSRTGIFNVWIKSVPYRDAESVILSVDWIEKRAGVGNLWVEAGDASVLFLAVAYPYTLNAKLQKALIDVASDIRFPNDLRSSENEGYEMRYRPYASGDKAEPHEKQKNARPNKKDLFRYLRQPAERNEDPPTAGHSLTDLPDWDAPKDEWTESERRLASREEEKENGEEFP